MRRILLLSRSTMARNELASPPTSHRHSISTGASKSPATIASAPRRSARMLPSELAGGEIGHGGRRRDDRRQREEGGGARLDAAADRDFERDGADGGGGHRHQREAHRNAVETDALGGLYAFGRSGARRRSGDRSCERAIGDGHAHRDDSTLARASRAAPFASATSSHREILTCREIGDRIEHHARAARVDGGCGIEPIPHRLTIRCANP